MQITQKSLHTFILKFKSSDVVINPATAIKDSISIYSRESDKHTIKQDESIMLIHAAGEYEAEDIFIHGKKVAGSDTIVYTIEAENINIGVINLVNDKDKIPEDFFTESDIVLIGIGGENFDVKTAEEVSQKLTPKMSILFGLEEQGSDKSDSSISMSKLEQELPAAKKIEKTLKITDEDLDRIDNTEIHYFEI